MSNRPFNNFDKVSVNDREGEWTIVEERGSQYFVQLGTDASTKVLVKSEQLGLIQKAKTLDDDGPRLIPMRGVMD